MPLNKLRVTVMAFEVSVIMTPAETELMPPDALVVILKPLTCASTTPSNATAGIPGPLTPSIVVLSAPTPVNRT